MAIDKYSPTIRRLRYSVRTLTVAVTLVCVYLGLWRLTDTRGIQAMNATRDNCSFTLPDAYSPFPLVITVVEKEPLPTLPDGFTWSGETPIWKRHLIWLFGPTIELPIKRTLESPTYSMEGPEIYGPDGKLFYSGAGFPWQK